MSDPQPPKAPGRDRERDLATLQQVHAAASAGRHEEAATEYRRAAATAATEPERAYLRRRLARVTG